MPAVRAIEQIKGGCRVVTTALGSFDVVADDIPESEWTKGEAEIATVAKSRCEAPVTQRGGDGKDALPFNFEVLVTKTADGPAFEVNVSDTPPEKVARR